MTVVKRVDPVSALKVGFMMSAMFGLLAGIACATIALSGVHFPPHDFLPIAGGLLAVTALFVCPILYGVIGSILTVVAVLFYNLACDWTGGLQVEVN
jgi:hypothetical protein